MDETTAPVHRMPIGHDLDLLCEAASVIAGLAVVNRRALQRRPGYRCGHSGRLCPASPVIPAGAAPGWAGRARISGIRNQFWRDAPWHGKWLLN